MAKGRILVADAIHDDAVEQLQKAGFDLALQTDITADQLVETIGEYDAIIVRGRTKVIRDVIEAGKSLKVIARAGVGLDNVDLAYAKEKGITVINSPEGPSVSVAELVFALALTVIRKVAFADQGIRQGQWLKKQSKGGELRGRRMGIWGFGLIGEEVAKRALAFEMPVFGFDIMPERIEVMKKLGVKFLPSDELTSVSDVLTVHVACFEEFGSTIGLLEKGDLKALVIFKEDRVKDKRFADIPVAPELGWDVTLGRWRGIGAKAGTPPEAIEHLHQVFKKAMGHSLYKGMEKSRLLDLRQGYMGPKELALDIEREKKTFEKVLKDLGYVK